MQKSQQHTPYVWQTSICILLFLVGKKGDNSRPERDESHSSLCGGCYMRNVAEIFKNILKLKGSSFFQTQKDCKLLLPTIYCIKFFQGGFSHIFLSHECESIQIYQSDMVFTQDKRELVRSKAMLKTEMKSISDLWCVLLKFYFYRTCSKIQSEWDSSITANINTAMK